MLKKFSALALTLLLGASTLLFACGDTEDSSTPDETSVTSSVEESSEAPSYSSLNEALSSATGTCELKIGDLTLETGFGSFVSLGSETLEEAVVDGLAKDGRTKAEITAIGGGQSAVRGKNGAKLSFKNIVFYDDSMDYEDRLFAYLEFSGTLRFENCDFKCHIFFKDSTNVEFVNCTFKSSESDRYAVWVGDGTATFTNCSFTGYRGLKIHEEGTWDIDRITLTGCTFENLTKKPGIAIGDIVVDPANTFITVTDCVFEDCQPWDSQGSVTKEGIDGFYESDTLTSTIGWSQSGNTVDGFDVSDDDICYK